MVSGGRLLSNSGLLGFPKGRSLQPSLYGWPLGKGISTRTDFPIDASRTLTDGSTPATSFNLVLDSEIAVGDLLLVNARASVDTVFTAPSGWSTLTEGDFDGSAAEQIIAYKFADGTEGSPQALTLTNSSRVAAITWRIPGAGIPRIGAVSAPFSSAPNPPAVTANIGQVPCLFIATGGHNDTRTLTGIPTDYENSVYLTTTGGGADDASVYGCSRMGVLTTQTEDPSAFAFTGGTANHSVWAICVPPTRY